MKVSIIIPIYNSEKYLKQCLESIINQTYKNIEIICINDGSTDNSEKIIKDYLKTNKNITYLKQPNAGQSIARNKGLEKATGDFILFVDSDDFIEKNMVEKLIDPLTKSSEIDLTFCDYYLYTDGKTEKCFTINEKEKDLKKQLILSAPSPCLKLFRKSYLKDFKFPENIIYEDYAIIPALIAKAKKVEYIQEHLYYYRQHSSSTTRNAKFTETKMDIIKASEILLNSIKDKEINKYQEEIEYLIIIHFILMGGLRFSRYPKARKKLQEISKFVQNNSIKIENNKYYQNLSKEKKKLIKIILNNDILGCYIFFIKRKLNIGGYSEI